MTLSKIRLLREKHEENGINQAFCWKSGMINFKLGIWYSN